jgi:hypothetical protein
MTVEMADIMDRIKRRRVFRSPRHLPPLQRPRIHLFGLLKPALNPVAIAEIVDRIKRRRVLWFPRLLVPFSARMCILSASVFMSNCLHKFAMQYKSIVSVLLQSINPLTRSCSSRWTCCSSQRLPTQYSVSLFCCTLRPIQRTANRHNSSSKLRFCNSSVQSCVQAIASRSYFYQRIIV